MLLARLCGQPEANLALEVFLRLVRDELGDLLLSVMLHGSVVFDDLAPGYGDLDFLAIIAGDLGREESGRLTAIRAPLRSGHYGAYCQMIEGAFLPAEMLAPDADGSGLWWGTTGEREWARNELGHLVLHTIREHALVIWGEDIRSRMPEIQRQDILRELLAGCEAARQHATPTSLQSLDFLFTPARELLWLNEGRLSSKSEAADWGYRNARGEWRRHLPRAKFLRRHPQVASCREVREWIAGLGPSILEATDELESALRSAMADKSSTRARRHAGSSG